MSLTAAALKELGAETRAFKTVKGCLLWYRDQLAQRLRVNRELASGFAPCSEERRQRNHATFAAIACAMRGIDHVAWLVAWYETTDGDGQWLAERAEMTRWLFVKRCRRTERELAGRLRAVGLLEEA